MEGAPRSQLASVKPGRGYTQRRSQGDVGLGSSFTVTPPLFRPAVGCQA